MENTVATIGLAILVLDWTIRIIFLFYVPKQRKPSAAMAWLLTIFTLPIAGAILFLAIGDTKLSRRRRQQQLSVNALIESITRSIDTVPSGLTDTEEVRYMPLITQNKALGKLPAHRGNTVTIIDDYTTMVDELVRAINDSRKYIYIQYYIIAYDPSTRRVFDALEAAIARGVDAYVLFDTIGSRRYKGYKKMQRTLTRIGAQWRPILPIRFSLREYNRPDLRNHRKIVVVDGEVAFMGSFNLIDASYERKDAITYEELVMRMTGPVVQQCAAVFSSDWFSETNEAPATLLEPIIADEQQGVLAQILPSGPSYEYENNLNLFVSLLYTAKKRVVITNPYFVPDDALLTAVTNAAQRGIEVTIINSAVKDQWLVGHAQRSYYTELLKAGVNIYLHDAPILLHSKHITIDEDIAVIGSSNMDIRSFQLNLECVAVLYDSSVVKQLQVVQDKNLSHATRITLEEWEHRPLHKETVDSLARLTASLQ